MLILHIATLVCQEESKDDEKCLNNQKGSLKEDTVFTVAVVLLINDIVWCGWIVEKLMP